MIYDEETVHAKDGTNVILRSAEISDSADLINYLKITAKETPYLKREPEEIITAITTDAVSELLCIENTAARALADLCFQGCLIQQKLLAMNRLSLRLLPQIRLQ